MHVRVLDLDGSIGRQRNLLARYRPNVVELQEWGPKIRLACRFGRFRRFEQDLARGLGGARDTEPLVTLYGSGDFHHVSLALLRRLPDRFNLLVIDNHPDWMWGVPFLHCGTWVYHAGQLPQVQRIFHAGGDVDFDNYYRWMAPWRLLQARKIVVLPAVRPFRRGHWSGVPNEPLRPGPDQPALPERIETLLQLYDADLARFPLYISLDKDVMTATDAIVNWDSGHLELTEVISLLSYFVRRSGGKLIGMDIVGDWSPVRLRGLFRRFFHWTEHPRLDVNAAETSWRNELTNLTLLQTLQSATGDLIFRAAENAP
jgi:hypothetical protein